QPFNTQLDYVPRLQVQRRLHTQPNTFRSSGRNDVSRQERHELAQIRDQMAYTENHIRGVGVLKFLSIHRKPQFKILRICHFIGGHQIRTHWCESVAALSFYPLPPPLELE